MLDAGELHRQAAFADLQQRDPVRLLRAALLFEPRDDILAAGETDDLLRCVRRRPPLLVELRHVPHHRPDCRAAVGLDDDAIARAERGIRRPVGDERLAAPLVTVKLTPVGRAGGCGHSCNVTQSATTLTPALRSSAASPRS